MRKLSDQDMKDPLSGGLILGRPVYPVNHLDKNVLEFKPKHCDAEGGAYGET
jgi:hypothetical protein